MNQYIRTNEDGNSVLDYNELDSAARINMIEDARRWAESIEVDVESETDATNAEKAEAINDAATATVKLALAYLYDDEGDEVKIDRDTQQMIIETIISELASRYNVEVA